MPEQESTEKKQLPQAQRKNQLLIALGGIGLLIALIAAGVFLFNQEDNGDNNQTAETTQEENAENLQLSEATTEMPDDFPDYIDIYEPSELLTSSTFGLEDSNNWIVTFETDSSIDAVYTFYEDYFSDDGWEVRSISTDEENYRTISAQNEDLGSEVSVSASTSEVGFTSFNISIGEKQQ